MTGFPTASTAPFAPPADPIALARLLERADEPNDLPLDLPVVMRPGEHPVNVLVIGCGPVHGLGHRSFGTSFGGRVADHLWRTTGRGVRIEIQPSPDPLAERARAELRGLRAWRFDAVVLAMGAFPDPASRQWRTACTRLIGVLETLRRDMVAGARIVVLGADPGGRATEGRVLRQEIRGIDAVSLVTARSTGRPDRLDEDHDAASCAEAVRRGLAIAEEDGTGLLSARLRRLPADESERLRAVERSGIVGLRGAAPFLGRIAVEMREAFGTADADVNVLSASHQLRLLPRIDRPRVMSRAETICDLVITGSGALVLPDTAGEPALRGREAVRGAHAIRFYAAVPLESPDGFRLGTVCIADPEPRSAGEVCARRAEQELGVFAHRVQQHLWEARRRA